MVSTSTILIADDSPANLNVLLETLKGRNYRLLVAKTGETAIRLAKEAKPNLILLDIIMPGMDGFTTCRLLKEDPETLDISIIFLSALDEISDKIKGLQMGAVDYISKPFQPDEVIARVATQIKVSQLELALKEKNIKLQASNERILQAMHEGVFGVDLKGCITFANPAAASTLGWSVDELNHMSISSVIGKQLFLEKKPPVKITLEKGIVQHVNRAVFWNNTGGQIPVSYSVTPIINPCELIPSGAVIVFSDISEKLKQESELHRMEHEIQHQKDKLTHMSRLSSMGEMASGFAHEVNQPLTAINNYAQACTRIIRHETPDMETLTDVMDKIEIQACRAGNIVSRIKNFVRKPQHVVEVIECNKMIRDIVTLAEVDTKDNNVNIHLDLTDNLPLIKVDPIQIQQVTLNLIRNAMEAMKNEDTRNIGVWVKTAKQDNQFIKVSVIDRGHGLKEEDERKLFTPFFSTKSSGMGIGLSVCHSIVEVHKGSLCYKRNPESGAIFEFTLPIDNGE